MVGDTRPTHVADRRMAPVFPATAAALGVLIVLLGAAVIPLTVLAR